MLEYISLVVSGCGSVSLVSGSMPPSEDHLEGVLFAFPLSILQALALAEFSIQQLPKYSW